MLDFATDIAASGKFETFVMLINRDCQMFDLVLADNIFVQKRFDLLVALVFVYGAAAVRSSSLIISLQISMHSLQTYTPGPAMSLRTSFCDTTKTNMSKLFGSSVLVIIHLLVGRRSLLVA